MIYNEQQLRPFFGDTIQLIEILYFSQKICLIFSWSVALKCSHYYIPHRACHSIFYQIELSHRYIHLLHCSWSKSRWSVLNHFLSLWCSVRYLEKKNFIFEGTDCLLCEVGDHHPRFLEGEVHRCPNFFKALIIVIISWRSSHFVAVNWLVNDSRAHIREKSTL